MSLKTRALCLALALALLPILASAATYTGKVNADKVLLRMQANTTCDYVARLSKGSKVTLLDVKGDFYKVQSGDYSGYIMKKYVTVSSSVLTKFMASLSLNSAYASCTTIKSLGSAPATSRKGDSGDKVEKLQAALKIKKYYSGVLDGIYGDGTLNAVKKYQKAVGLTADGVAGAQTIKKLFGQNAANVNYTTERLDWFNGGDSVIPKGATFTVKDVKTGKTFTVKRWSGVNHLDAEPLTKDDTATMKSIYGGAWSWTRRAILVLYNGHVYAASMNGMPHGTTTIDNGFDGHFCIHFYKSRTHETNKVDTAHQNCVAQAMKAVW